MGRKRGTTPTINQGETDMSDVDVIDGDVVENEPATEAPAAAEATPAKAAKTKDELPEGYVTPVGFTHVLRKPSPEGRGVDVRPQVIYGYVRNNKEFKEFTKNHTDGRFIFAIADGLAWWDKKEVTKAEKAAAKAAAPAEAASDTDVTPSK